ncbi:MAG: hypothetical protein HUU01_16445 [Saprospiraceae bacterium]|nr:hypothetical protein [Saprospiraceae bacterium]
MQGIKWLFALFVLLGVGACKKDQKTQSSATTQEPVQDSAAWVVEKTFEAHASAALSNSITEFDFRNYHFKVTRKGGAFSYERSHTDSAGNALHDVLTHTGFYRERNGQRMAISEKDSLSLGESVNSVVYFALLPYFLKDRAVKKTLLENSTIKGEAYYKLGVRFDESGGGKDFQDEYVYWIHREHFTMDYLAYSYQDGEGPDASGVRFREAFNVRVINGIRFADYRNFKPKGNALPRVVTLDRVFETDGLEQLSLVELNNVKVHLLQ